ncbi:MAG: heat-inducible transcriptional repressor HrcA [Actinomycetota bacterium]
MPEPLGERRAAILRAIVREYISSGEPVGSKHLVDRSKLEVSSATVRNEMARLEELGYLAQPHTSAGRVPTDAGYRFVVDEIQRPRSLPATQKRALAEEFGETPGSLDDLLKRAGDAVSKLTQQVSALASLRSQTSDVRLRRLELFAAGERAVQAVLIAENGRLEQRLLSLPGELPDEDLVTLSDRLGKELHGLSLVDAEAALRVAAQGADRIEASLLNGIADAVRALADAERHVFVGGVANLALEETFERDTLHRLYEALEAQTKVAELLTDSIEEGVQVRIGHEVAPRDFDACSVIVAGFTTPDGGRGTIGIIGPTRIDYERMMATAAEAAKMIGQTLGEE